MNDQEFLEQIENCTLPKEELRHLNHLRLGWLYLKRYSSEQAPVEIKNTIVRYAKSIGAESIYHETLTQLWVKLIQGAMGGEESFEVFMQGHPELLNKDLPKLYYSEALMKSEKAQKEWVEPDLKALS